MKTSVVVQRLKATVPLLGGRVGGSAGFEAATSQTDLAVPCAYVLPLGEEVQSSEMLSETVHDVVEQFAIVAAVANTSDDRGQAAADQIDDIRGQLLAALLGWHPSVAHGRMEYRGGQLIDMDRARLWWQFEFAVYTEYAQI